MGCFEDRPSALEGHLQDKAISTGFENHSTSHVVTTILRYSRLPAPLTSNAFEAIRSHLDLKPSKSSSQIEQLYTETFIGKYPRTLLVAGILLSKGDERTKATALYEAYDTQAESMIREVLILEMLQELFGLAAKGLKVLYVNVSREDLNYFEEIEQNVGKGSKEVAANLLNGTSSLPKNTFIERLSVLKHGSLLQLYGLRQYLHGLSSSNKP